MMKSLFSSSSQRAFDDDRERQPHAERRSRGNRKRDSGVEQEAVDDVREGVPVGDVLGIFRALHDAVPELHVPHSQIGMRPIA